MLERTAGCLESGNLRRLVPISKKSLKSRRTLHSTFWHHGAGDLEFSPIWAALVRAMGPAEEKNEVMEKTSTVRSAMLLDFLYPAGAINFIRQHSGWGVDRQEVRWGRIGFGKLGYRQYTSSAKDTSTTEETSGSQPIVSRESDIEHVDLKFLYQKLGLTKNFDYEEAWRQYLLLDGVEQQSLRKPLMQYFSKSDRIVDAERTTELLEMISDGQRDSSIYKCAIRAYLKLRNLSDAMELYETALKTLKAPAGAEELLGYFVQNSLWSPAFSFWINLKETKFESPLHGKYIFDAVESLPTLGERAVELAEYVSKRLGNAPPDSTEDNTKLTDFGARIIRKALNSRQSFSPSRTTTLLGFLYSWKIDEPVIYHDAIKTLISIDQSHLAIKCYRQARQLVGVKFSRSTLMTVLTVFCEHHSILGMKEVLDDFFTFYTGPTRIAYRMCMAEFAQQGDAKTVHALFEQYTRRFSNTRKGEKALSNANELAPLLQVHAKRGEISQVVRIFSEIETVYRLQPTLLCWNILINAYGKVHDTDAAYECFGKLFESQTPYPDDYTFGTMMNICSSNGDLDRVLDVYALAEEFKIEKSSAMLDSLVDAYIQEDDLQQAEKICEDAIKMTLKGSRTRMWNSLLVAYALRRNLTKVNQLLQRMAGANVDYDQHTYSALMMALCLVNQPDRAYVILKEVMKEAGVRVTSFHYAAVMAGFILIGQNHRVFEVHNRLMRRDIARTTSSDLVLLQATMAEDEALLEEGTEQEILQRAKQMLRDVMALADPQHLSQAPRRGSSRLPLDVAYSTPFYSNIMFVLGQLNDFESVTQFYEEFKRTIPESRQDPPPIEILESLMATKLKQGDHDAVKECWDLILSEAIEQGQSLPLPSQITRRLKPKTSEDRGTSGDIGPHSQDASPLMDSAAKPQVQRILPAHKFALGHSIVLYLRSLVMQNRVHEATETVRAVLNQGFALDQHTWNKYVELMARRYQFRLAFQLCEEWMMPNWTGWAGIRWTSPKRNRLPLDLRRARTWKSNIRPYHTTLLYLARSWLEIQAMAAESIAYENLLSDLDRDCPKLVNAIKTMPRNDDEMERRILRDYF